MHARHRCTLKKQEPASIFCFSLVTVVLRSAAAPAAGSTAAAGTDAAAAPGKNADPVPAAAASAAASACVPHRNHASLALRKRQLAAGGAMPKRCSDTRPWRLDCCKGKLLARTATLGKRRYSNEDLLPHLLLVCKPLL